jgi:Zn-dependent protease with chaperone function
MRNKKSEVKKKGNLMTARAIPRWTLFAVYVATFFAIPLYLVGDLAGLAIGLVAWAGFLLFLRIRGTERILKRLNVQYLSKAHNPTARATTTEYCRRLGIAEPKLGLIPSSAVNIGVFGFSRRNSYLLVTQGALDQLSRDQLSSLIGRELCYYSLGDVPCETWLSQFLWIFDKLLMSSQHRNTTTSRRIYTVKLFSKQVLFFPLTLFPSFILRGSRDASRIDVMSVKLTKRSNSLSGAFRRMEALQERIPFPVSFGDRHLFLLPPRTQDPLARVFFKSESFSNRVSSLEAASSQSVITA